LQTRCKYLMYFRRARALGARGGLFCARRRREGEGVLKWAACWLGHSARSRLPLNRPVGLNRQLLQGVRLPLGLFRCVTGPQCRNRPVCCRTAAGDSCWSPASPYRR
jgi:hypothetical protein